MHRNWKRHQPKALLKYKRDTQIVYLVAEGLNLLGKKEDAATLLKEHLNTKPWDVHCLYLLGLIYEETGECENALDCFKKGLKNVENYSVVFRESFSKMISESRDQVLQKLNEIENKNKDKNCAYYDMGNSG